MNHIYRLVWNDRQQAYVAATENVRSRGKSSSVVGTAVASVVLALAGHAGTASATQAANTLPTGGQVSAGVATISTSANTLTVDQSSQRAAINWNSFSVGSNASVNFNQPSASAITLNRVVGNESSVIDGAINANGNVWILNSSGILFNRNAQVNVGGLVASTLGMNDASFMAGSTAFEGNGSSGSILNLGTLQAANAGHIALLGQHVANEGVITATLGSAVLAAGDKVTLNFNGNSLVGVTVDRGVLNALVENRNAIVADGGRVILTAKGLDGVMSTVVNNTGEIQAQTIQNQEGKILLLGGMQSDSIVVAGTLDASAPNGGNGGYIETSAAHVTIADSARVTTSAPGGQSGTWLIDPADFTIAASGGDISGATLSAQLSTTDVSIHSSTGSTSAGSGDININTAVNWNSHLLTLTAARNVNVNAVLTASGSASIDFEPATANGSDSAVAGGAVNFAMTNSGSFTGKLNISGTGTVTVRGTQYTVINSLGSSRTDTTVGTLEGINSNNNGNYVLGSDIDATATNTWSSGFYPLGGSGSFSGHLNGFGHTIDHLWINASSSYTGFIHYLGSGGVVSNLGLTNENLANSSSYTGGVTGYTYSTSLIDHVFVTGQISGSGYVAGMVGWGVGTIKNSYTNVTVSSSGDYLGGLVAYFDGSSNGYIKNAFALGAVNGGNSHSYAGGLVGYAYETPVSQSFASGNVTGRNYVGGLVGESDCYSTCTTDTYATGNVTGVGDVGGLIGVSYSDVLSNAYSRGLVSGTSAVGGLIGLASGTTVSHAYWDVSASGQATSAGGATAITDSGQMQNILTYAGFGIVGDSALVVGAPTLRWATSGVSAGSSIWVIGTAVAPNPATPPSSGSSSAATNNQVAYVNDTAVLPQGPSDQPLNLGDGVADHLLPASYVVNEPGALTPLRTPGVMPSNVAVVPPDVNLSFGPSAELALISVPDGEEPANSVTLTQARAMTARQSSGGVSGGDREVRVPVSRNSLAQIVNGGVRLPGGVEQQLFVVQK